MTTALALLMICIIALAGFLTWFASQRRNLLLSFVAGILWFGMSMWLFFAPVPIIDLAYNYAKILAWAFFALTFLPFVLYMNVRITKTDKKGNSWTEYGDVPKDEKSPYEKYAEDLHNRMYRHKRPRRLL